MVWGLVVSGAGTLFMAISLAEICHVYPLSGGQYDWACEWHTRYTRRG
jgi:amino acid transporter